MRFIISVLGGSNRISEGTEALEAYIQIAVPLREGAVDIVSEDEIIAFGVLVPECAEISEIKVVRGPLAFDSYRFFPLSGEYEIHFVSPFVSPVGDFSVLGRASFQRRSLVPRIGGPFLLEEIKGVAAAEGGL